jgi:hypothetical protein
MRERGDAAQRPETSLMRRQRVTVRASQWLDRRLPAAVAEEATVASDDPAGHQPIAA